MDQPFRIAILASGKGSNAQRIIEHFEARPLADVVLVLTDRSDAGVIRVAKDHDVPFEVLDAVALKDGEELNSLFDEADVDLVVLAGFLKKVPPAVVRAHEGRLLNLHPALLPRHGGKGMYGAHVHQAVLDAGDPVSGITIHQVNENYDDGDIVFQAECPVDPEDTVDTLSQRVRALEHEHYPKVIEHTLKALANE